MKKVAILMVLALLLSLCIEVEKEKPQKMEAKPIKKFVDSFGRYIWSYNTSARGGIIAYVKDGAATEELDQAGIALLNLTTMKERDIHTRFYQSPSDTQFIIGDVELNGDGVVWFEVKKTFVAEKKDGGPKLLIKEKDGSVEQIILVEGNATTNETQEAAIYFYNLTTNKKEVIHNTSLSITYSSESLCYQGFKPIALYYQGDKIAWIEYHYNNSESPSESLVYLYDLTTKEKKPIPSLSSQSVYPIGIYKDVIVFGDAELGIIGKYYINDGKIEKIIDLKNGTEKTLLDFPDSTLLYTIEGKNAVWGYNIENDTNFFIYESPSLENVSQDEYSFNTVAWDGDLLVWVSEDGIHVCNIKSKEERRILGLSDIEPLLEIAGIDLSEIDRPDDARIDIRWLRIYNDKLIIAILGDLYIYTLPEELL